MKTPQQMARYLIEQGLTQRDIAQAAGTSQPRISGILRGEGCSYMIGKSLENIYYQIIKEKLEAKNEVV